jgi:hypothetical protein
MSAGGGRRLALVRDPEVELRKYQAFLRQLVRQWDAVLDDAPGEVSARAESLTTDNLATLDELSAWIADVVARSRAPKP